MKKMLVIFFAVLSMVPQVVLAEKCQNVQMACKDSQGNTYMVLCTCTGNGQHNCGGGCGGQSINPNVKFILEQGKK